jgi:hypothetical protein
MTSGALDATLPPPVERWLETSGLRGLERIETVGSSGTGRVRLGRLPWLPIDHRTVHRLGRDEVRDIRLRVGPIPVLRVLDAYVDGAGITKIGPVPAIGLEVDKGAALAMWAEAIAWPAAWDALPGLAWEPVDDGHARLHLPLAGGTEVMDVTFDAATSFPSVFEVDRYKSKGRKVRWRADCSDLRPFGVIRAWGHVRVTWADEPGPWYEASIERIVPHVSVETALDRARRAIASARRDG